MNRFCGSDLWDWNTTWNTNEPDFTICFKKTVLTWFPLAVVWVFAPLEFWYIANSLCRDVPRNWLHFSKLVVTVCLLLLSILETFAASFQLTFGGTVYPVDFVNPLLKILTFEVVIFLILLCRSHGISRSGVLFWFWLSLIVCNIMQLRSEIIHVSQTRYYNITNVTIYLALVVINFLLTFIHEPLPKSVPYRVTDKLCPVNFTTFPSLITFSFVNGIICKGNKRPLEYNDLWDIHSDLSSKWIAPLFDKHYKSQCKDKRPVVNPSEKEDTYEVQQVTDSIDEDGRSSLMIDKPMTCNRNVLPALCKSFCPSFMFAVLLYFFQVILSYVNPQILKQLIMFVNNKDKGNGEAWKGYFFSICLFLAVTIQTILSSQYFFRIFTTSLKIRVALTSVIYRKALSMSSTARKERTHGQIVNLMAVDVNKCSDTLPFINLIWAIPLRIALAIFWLWKDLGTSVMAGLCILLVLLPFQVYVATINKRFQMKQMKYKDDRIKLMSEILNGFKALRLYAWEQFFEQKIVHIRNKEIKYLKRTAIILASMSFFWLCTPYLMAVSSFACYLLTDANNVLTPQVAFVSLALFNLLQIPLALFPLMIGSLVQGSVSLRRINDFLNSDELNEDDISHDVNEENVVVIENGTFSWGDELVLKNIKLRIPAGSLVAVVGTIGSGKSSLISALLGDIPKVSGHVNIKGTIAYVPQQPWIQDGTIRNNILFGRSYEKRLYDKVVEACALNDDFKQLPAGDYTKISGKGNNLSGGQKQRISLARAVYSGADLYLMDDPLSAVDSKVSKYIFDQIISSNGILANKTRLVITQSVSHLHNFSRIVVLKDGEISEDGTFNDLLSKRGAFSMFVLQYLTSPNDIVSSDSYKKPGSNVGSSTTSISIDPQHSLFPHNQMVPSTSASSKPKKTISYYRSQEHNFLYNTSSLIHEASDQRRDKLVEEEHAETGNVKLVVYRDYMAAMGYKLVIIMLFMYSAYQVFLCCGNVWLSHCTDKNVDSYIFLSGYVIFGIGQMISVGIATLLIYLGAMIASKTLHNNMLHNVFRLPLLFYNITPYGRILNRFSKDVEALDSMLPINLQGFIGILFMVIGTLIIIEMFLPLFVLFIVPFTIVYFFIQRFYVTVSRQLKRLESINRSPIYSHFEESLSGASSIRAFGVQNRFIEENHEIMERSIICTYPSIICDRWLQVRLEMVGNFIIFLTALCAVFNYSNMAAGDVGLTITYALTITINLNMLVRNVSMVETNIVCAERIKEYTKLPQEAPWKVKPNPVDAEWPKYGEIKFVNYNFRYRDELEYALRDVTFTINGGEKVGIVGRTGAGKSSLSMALFRVIEASSGTIYIDGVDISTVGLSVLRSRLTIIPQEPVLFSGSLRMNLDPGHQYKDKKLQQVLEVAHLSGLTNQLDLMVQEGGENFSVGQRQLLCLARALLRKTKVLILDEATASIDFQTEELIQDTIRAQFSDCTILTIAHRMKTIMDSDRVLVLSEGKVVEFDSPSRLLENKLSVFCSLARDAGII